MLRININSITYENGKYYYREEPYTGVAFILNNCKVEKAMVIKSGDIYGEYINEYLSGMSGALKIDSDCLVPEEEGEDEPLCYNGKRFSGIGYDFDEDFCTGELTCTNGWLGSQVSYYRSGVLKSVELIDDNFSQVYYWYEDGQIKQYEIFERNAFDVRLCFDKYGDIVVLSIDGNYFNRIEDLKSKLKFKYFNDKYFAVKLSGVEFLYVSGSAIDDEIFDDLLKNDGLRNTSKLHISRTPLTMTSIEKLISLKKLNKLYIDSEILSLEDMKKFKSQRPACYLEFNRTKVTD